MLGVYNYTVILTYIGMLSGFSGILCAFEGNVVWAIVCLMISGVCDMFDGKVASTKQERSRSEKRFGIQIDSVWPDTTWTRRPDRTSTRVGARSIWACP